MSPYIVTTRRVNRFDDYEQTGEDMRIVSRRVVATLEEARSLASDAAYDSGLRSIKDADAAHFAISESGGTVGPFPDGTVIEVEQVGWAYLLSASGITGGSNAQIIDAFNARHS